MINYLIYNIIFLNIFFAASIISYILLKKLTQKSKDIFQYKVISFIKSWSISLAYVGFFIIVLYGLRIYNIPRSIDLKEIITNMHVPLQYLFNNILLTLNFSITVVSLTVLILSAFINVYKVAISHIFNLYLYYWYSYKNRKLNIVHKKIYMPLQTLGSTYIISACILGIFFKIYRWCNNYVLLPYDYKYPWYRVDAFLYKTISRIVYNRVYSKYFFICTPLFFILYDCFFNNFIIMTVFYYMLIYIPVVLLKRITTKLFSESTYICELVWDICYLDEDCIYAISQKDLNLLHLYVYTLEMDTDLGLEAELYLVNVIRFSYDLEDNITTYYNTLGNTLRENPAGSFYEYKKYSQTYLCKSTEAWILIANKKKDNED